jgi:hypothetical protein
VGDTFRMNLACCKPYNADFDKLCRKQEAWKGCNLLVNNLFKKGWTKTYLISLHFNLWINILVQPFWKGW